jgi:DNA (cytosine-5)-methyltransferase 1
MARIARGISRYVVHASTPFLVNLTHGTRTEEINRPLNTLTGAHRGEKAIISPLITAAQQGGSNRSAHTPIHTITASPKDQNCVAAAFVAQHNNDIRREGGVNPGRPATVPLSTITQRGTQQNVVSAFVSRQFGTSTGHAMEQPLATTTADGGGKSALIAPHLCTYYGVDQDTPANEPLHTLTTKPRFGLVEAQIEVPPFVAAQASRARQVADFLRQFGLWDDREFVTFEVGGMTLVIVDIGMRMLIPRELYNAQGFPKNYRIDGVWEAANDNAAPVWVPFPKTLQVSCVGNSVSPPVAKAIVAANCSHLAIKEWKVAA